MSIALRLLAAVVTLALSMFAQQSNRPDFSGTWRLDPQLTRFGKIPQPKSLIVRFEQRDPWIRIFMVTTTEQGEKSEAFELMTDGTQHPLTVEGSCTATARWDQATGTRLIVEINCGDSSLSRRFTLGQKGQILTTILTLKDSSGEKKAYEFFSKEGGTSSAAAARN